MAKKFDIHEWQAKQRLAEQEEFTPDLEDDDLKRSKIQQMMAKEKGNATPVDGGMNQGDYDKVVDLLDRYSLGELLDAAVEFYQTGGEDESAELANKFATDFRKFLDSKDGGEEDELEEQNATGTATSFSAGDGEGYATPNAFAKKDKWKGKKAVYEQEEEELGVDWSVATDDQIRAIGGDVYYGSDQSPEPTDDGGQRMLVPPDDGWPQIGDSDGDGDVDVDDVDWDDPEGGAVEKETPPRDVDYIHNMMIQKINNRQEYGPFVRAVLEMDVPQKTAAFQQTFKDMVSLKNLLIKFFGDEDDKSTKYSWTADKKANEKKKKSGGRASSSLIPDEFEPFDYEKGKIDKGFSRRAQRDIEKGYKSATGKDFKNSILYRKK